MTATTPPQQSLPLVGEPSLDMHLLQIALKQHGNHPHLVLLLLAALARAIAGSGRVLGRRFRALERARQRKSACN